VVVYVGQCIIGCLESCSVKHTSASRRPSLIRPSFGALPVYSAVTVLNSSLNMSDEMGTNKTPNGEPDGWMSSSLEDQLPCAGERL
jgi:hypothetical protein